MNILVLGFEVIGTLFSGNSYYTRTLLRSLLSCPSGQRLTITVVCACDADDAQVSCLAAADPEKLVQYCSGKVIEDSDCAEELTRVHIISVLVPRSKWFSIDRRCGYIEWGLHFMQAYAAGSHAATFIADHPQRYDWIMCLDWTGFYFFERTLYPRWEMMHRRPPLAFVMMRIFSMPLSSVAAANSGNGHGDNDVAFYKSIEDRARQVCSITIAHSDLDAKYLHGSRRVFDSVRKERIVILLPPVRTRLLKYAADPFMPSPSPRSSASSTASTSLDGLSSYEAEGSMRDCFTALSCQETPLTPADDAVTPHVARDILLCVMRISREKNPLMFLKLVEHLVMRLPNQPFGRVVLVGSISDPEYYQTQLLPVIQRLKDKCDFTHVSVPQSAAEMAVIYRQAYLMVHPALSESFGMVLPEAASFGCDVLVDQEAHIGCASLFPPCECAWNASSESGTDECAISLCSSHMHKCLFFIDTHERKKSMDEAAHLVLRAFAERSRPRKRHPFVPITEEAFGENMLRCLVEGTSEK